MRGSGAGGARHDPGMDDFTDDDLFLDLIESVTLGVLHRIGEDQGARSAFFKRFVDLAREVVQDAGDQGSVTRSRR